MTSRLRHAAALLAAALAALACAPGASAARHELQPVSRSELGRVPVTIHDRVLPRSAHARVARAASAARGGYYHVGPDVVHILVSPNLAATDNEIRSYATLFSSFYHGSELRSLTVFLAPYAEMQSPLLCGGEADSCYDPSQNEIILVGEKPPDGTPIPDLAAHEYGHHIAEHRNNSPWYAGDWGPKRWATHQGICSRVRAHTAYPGDEESHYELNPGEGWAETNRVLNGGTDPWVRVAGSFYPSATDLRLAKEDILSPWHGNRQLYRTGSLRRGSPSRMRIRLAGPLDGRAAVSLHTRGHLDADLYVYANGRLVGSSTHSGHSDLVRGTACGWHRVTVEVRRYSGSGSFVVHTSLP